MGSATRADLLSSQVRRRIVDLVAARPGELAASDLARVLDLHVTTVRFHLDQLEQAGVLTAERERRVTVGRPRKVYAVVAERSPVNETGYAVLVEVLVEVLADALPDAATRSRAAARAGASWAARHVTDQDLTGRSADPSALPVKEVVDVLARWGYGRESVTVERTAPGCHRLTLSECPLKEAALARPEVVCATHQGLIQGTLARLGAPGAAVDVQPMVTPDTCVVDLALAGAVASDLPPTP